MPEPAKRRPKNIPRKPGTKNLGRYAHTGSFNRLAGKKEKPKRFRHQLHASTVAIVIGVILLVFFGVGFGFVIF